MTPPPWSVQTALEAAHHSPCAKSKRGVAAYRGRVAYGIGYNAPALGACGGDDACRAVCSKICVHAEMAALRRLPRGRGGYDLVHVKIDAAGQLVAGGGPSCWQCSREILACGLVHGVWLYEEAAGPAWCYYSAEAFHRVTLENCGLAMLVENMRLDRKSEVEP